MYFILCLFHSLLCVKSGVSATLLVQYIHSKSGGGGGGGCGVYKYSKYTPMYHFCIHVYFTDIMHLQMQVMVCMYHSIHTVVCVAYVTYASAQVY